MHGTRPPGRISGSEKERRHGFHISSRPPQNFLPRFLASFDIFPSYEHVDRKKHIFLFPSIFSRPPGWLRFSTGVRMLQGMLGKLNSALAHGTNVKKPTTAVVFCRNNTRWGGYFWCCCWDLRIFGNFVLGKIWRFEVQRYTLLTRLRRSTNLWFKDGFDTVSIEIWNEGIGHISSLDC